MRRLLFLAFNREAWGEAALGVRLAHACRSAGDEVRFLALDRSRPLLEGQPFPTHYLSRVAYRLGGRRIDDLVRGHQPDALVLADLDQCLSFLQAIDLPSTHLAR